MISVKITGTCLVFLTLVIIIFFYLIQSRIVLFLPFFGIAGIWQISFIILSSLPLMQSTYINYLTILSHSTLGIKNN